MKETLFHERSRKILLADEPTGWTVNFIDTLRSRSVRIVLARSEQQGWDVLRREQVDLAVIAGDNPRIGGLDLVRRVHWVSTDLPVIVVSGQTNFRWLGEALKIGVRTVFPRPVDVQRLIEMSVKLLKVG